MLGQPAQNLPSLVLYSGVVRFEEGYSSDPSESCTSAYEDTGATTRNQLHFLVSEACWGAETIMRNRLPLVAHIGYRTGAARSTGPARGIKPSLGAKLRP